MKATKKPLRLFFKLLAKILLFAVFISVLLIVVFRWVPLPGSSVMLQRLISEQTSQSYDWTPLSEVSPWAALAVIAAEDQKFLQHNGIDFDSLGDAIADRLDGKRLRGASTLTQQVARNLFLWQGRSFVRKGLELYFTALLEIGWSKRRILEVYLNIAETGPRTFGFERASQRYYGIPAKKLSAEQAAMIAAILPNPIERRADQPSEFVVQRQQWILKQMHQLGGLEYLQNL